MQGYFLDGLILGMDLRYLDEDMALAGLLAGAARDHTVLLAVRCAENTSDVDPFIQSCLDLGLNLLAADDRGTVACWLVLPSFNLQGDPVP